MPDSRSEWIVSFLIKTLAVVGILYQVLCQTESYLSYPFYSSIAIGPVHMRLPAIAFCASYWAGSLEKYYVSLPVYNASRLMPSYDETINYCHLTLPNATVVDCRSISKPHKYMNHLMICYSLFEKNRTHLPDEDLMYSPKAQMQNEIITPFLRMKFNSPWNDSDHWTITIREAHELISLIRSTEEKVYMQPQVNKQVILKFSVTRRVELPPPHGSCKHYPPPSNSDTSIIECWFQTYYTDERRTKKFWPKWMFFDYEKNYTQEEMFRKIPKNGSSFGAVNTACMKNNSPVDCERSYIILDKVATVKNPLKGDSLTIEIPWLPETQLNITNHIATPLLEYFNQVGGILSMWVGFAIYPFYLQLESLGMKCIYSVSRKKNSMRQSTNSSTVNDLSRRDDKVNSQLLRLNDLAMKLLCWLTTLYFVVEIILIYFERPFHTQVIAEVPVTIDMLEVSICFNMIIHPEKMKKLFPQVYETISQEKWPEVLNIEQIFTVTTEWHQVYKPKSNYLVPDGTYKQIHRHFNFSKSITGKYTCFTTLGEQEYLASSPRPKYLRASIAFARQWLFTLNTGHLHQFNGSKIRFYFHKNGIVRDDPTGSNRFVIVGYKDARLYPNHYVIRMFRTVRRLFPDHLKSCCWNYKDKFGLEREILLNRCVIKNFIGKYNLWPAGYQVWQTSRLFDDASMNLENVLHLRISNQSMHHNLNMIREKCNDIFYKPECEKLYLKVRLEGFSFAEEINETVVAMYPPSKNFLIYEEQLKYTVIDILGYIGGTVNAWIGLSFLEFKVLLMLFRLPMKQNDKRIDAGSRNRSDHSTFEDRIDRNILRF